MLEEVASTVENILSTPTLWPCEFDISRTAQLVGPCVNYTDQGEYEDDESKALQRVVSWVVPLFFGIIGLAGLLGNALVVIGEYSFWIMSF